MSVSSNEPSSNRVFILSLAVSFPSECCFSILFVPPLSRAFSLLDCNSEIISLLDFLITFLLQKTLKN